MTKVGEWDSPVQPITIARQNQTSTSLKEKSGFRLKAEHQKDYNYGGKERKVKLKRKFSKHEREVNFMY